MIKTALKNKSNAKQLGELLVVEKAQLSRLENSTGNVTFETEMIFFDALATKNLLT